LNKIQYFRNFRSQSAGLAIAQLINILTLPVVTRYYTPEEMGLYSVFVQALGFATILLSFRAEHVIMIRGSNRASNEFCLQILLMAGVLCVVQAGAVLLAYVYDLIPEERLAWVILLPPVAYVFVASYALQQLEQRAGGFRRSGFSEVAARLVTSTASVCGGILQMAAVSLAACLMLGYLAKSLVYWDRIRILYRLFWRSGSPWPSWAGLWQIRRSLTSLSGSHLLLFGTSILPLIHIEDSYGLREVGLYSLVVSTLYFPTALLGAALGSVYYQAASRSHAKGEGFSGLFWANVKYLSVGAILMFGAISILAPHLYEFVFGAQWEGAGDIARVYCLAAAVAFITVPLDRSGVVVNAWWYGVSWHTMRLMTTVGAIIWSSWSQLSFSDFVLLITIQITLMHLIDGVASFCFAGGYFGRRPA
jgi:teichuronic acid exporter